MDFGQARAGLAIDDELGKMAHPRGVLPARDEALLVRELAAFAEREGVGRFVVGLPREMSGREGLAARRVRAFAKRLANATKLPVELVDERWTTVGAARDLEASGLDAREAKARIDEASAVAILDAYLSARDKD